MDIVFKPDGNFDEVYLYEELMEADLHAIVSDSLRYPRRLAMSDSELGDIDPIWSTTFRCALPVVPLPDALWSQVHPLRERATS
jgi:hypothetical protein